MVLACLVSVLASAQASTCTDGRRLGFNLTNSRARLVKGGDLPNSFMLLKVVMEKMKSLSGSRISMAYNGGLVVKGFHFGTDVPEDTVVGLGASSSHGLEASLSPVSLNTEIVEMWRDTRLMSVATSGTWSLYVSVNCDFHADFDRPSDSRFLPIMLYEYMRKNTKGFNNRRWSEASDSDGPQQQGSDRTPLVLFKDLGSAVFCSCLEALNIFSCVTILEFFIRPETIQMLIQDRINNNNP